MIERQVSAHVKRLARQYPVIAITGPRQSGKTTLCQALFPNRRYVSLEEPDQRDFARRDPRGFLDDLGDATVIDEIQRVPDLASWIQGRVDRTRRNGRYILTGSQSFEMMSALGQSLAGRVAIVRLLPFSYQEAYGDGKPPTLDKVLFTGFYPRIHDRRLNPTEALSFYVSTYIERDLRSILRVQDLHRFETYLKLLAGRTGQILNLSALGADAGVSHNTARSWLTLLEASFIVGIVPSFHANLRKRLVKAPKVHFLDTGLAAYLVGIREAVQMKTHPLRGALFESYVHSELLKNRLNAGRPADIHYFRESNGHEVDFVEVEGSGLVCHEAKSGKTIPGDAFRNLHFLSRVLKRPVEMNLVYGGDEALTREGVRIRPWRNCGAE